MRHMHSILPLMQYPRLRMSYNAKQNMFHICSPQQLQKHLKHLLLDQAIHCGLCLFCNYDRIVNSDFSVIMSTESHSGLLFKIFLSSHVSTHKLWLFITWKYFWILTTTLGKKFKTVKLMTEQNKTNCFMAWKIYLILYNYQKCSFIVSIWQLSYLIYWFQSWQSAYPVLFLKFYISV